MQPANLFLTFLAPMNRARIEYMVTGAAAATMYGEPRLTDDIDLVVALRDEHIAVLRALFPAEQFYCPPDETIRTELHRSEGGHLNVIHRETGFKADLYPAGEDPLHVWGMGRRRFVDLEGESIAVAPPEYVIIRKLQYYRDGSSEKHLADFKAMLRVSSELIEMELLEAKVRELGLQKEWDLCQTKMKG